MEGFDAVPAGGDLKVSATLYTTWLRCPQQALARLRGFFAPPSKATFRGALAHRVFARHLAGGAIGDEEFDQVCREETGANLNAQLAEVGLRPSEFRAVVAEVADLYRRFRSYPLDGLVDAEVPFEADVAEGIGLRGRVDAVFEDEQGMRIVDWKTGATLDETTKAQLAFYAMAWGKVSGSAPTTSEAVSLATGETVAVPVDEEALAAVEADVAKMVTQLREAMGSGSDLARTGGPHCQWCPVLEDCDEGSTAVALLAQRR